MAKADRQPAPKFVYLKVVTTALGELGLSDASITRGIFQGCGDGSIGYRHTGEAPPAGFWRNSNNAKFNASDVSNILLLPADAGPNGFYTFTLHDVMLDWESVVARNPALRGTEPPQLGRSRVEVSFTAPLMQLVRWFATSWRRAAPSAEVAPVANKKQLRKRDEALEWLLEKKEQNPPKYWGRKLKWCRERLKEGPQEFAEGEFPWTTPRSIESKLNDLIASRLVRDPATGHVVPRSKLKK